MRLPLATLLVNLLWAGPQDETPTIKVEVNVVNILATVRDSRGALVNSLTQDDFEILEDGKPQQVRYFSRETNLPLTLGLLVDVSASQRNLLQVERRAAEQFLDSVLQKEDLAFIISFGAEVELLQDLTSSRILLSKGLEQLRLSAPPPAPTGSPVPTIYQPRGTVLFDAVYLASTERLQSEVGRKAIVLITTESTPAAARSSKTPSGRPKKPMQSFTAFTMSIRKLTEAGAGAALSHLTAT